MRSKFAIISAAVAISFNLLGCGEKSSSSSSSDSSNLRGLSSESKERYNNLPPEGKAEFNKAMKEYDKSKK